jgi:hypothetical protein
MKTIDSTTEENKFAGMTVKGVFYTEKTKAGAPSWKPASK